MSSEMLPRDQMIVALQLLGFQLVEDSWIQIGEGNTRMQFDLINAPLNMWVFGTGADDETYVNPYTVFSGGVGPALRYSFGDWNDVRYEVLAGFYAAILNAMGR